MQSVPKAILKVVGMVVPGVGDQRLAWFYQDGMHFGPGFMGVRLPLVASADAAVVVKSSFVVKETPNRVVAQEFEVDGEFVLLVVDYPTPEAMEGQLTAAYSNPAALKAMRLAAVVNRYSDSKGIHPPKRLAEPLACAIH